MSVISNSRSFLPVMCFSTALLWHQILWSLWMEFNKHRTMSKKWSWSRNTVVLEDPFSALAFVLLELPVVFCGNMKNPLYCMWKRLPWTSHVSICLTYARFRKVKSLFKKSWSFTNAKVSPFPWDKHFCSVSRWSWLLQCSQTHKICPILLF